MQFFVPPRRAVVRVAVNLGGSERQRQGKSAGVAKDHVVVWSLGRSILRSHCTARWEAGGAMKCPGGDDGEGDEGDDERVCKRRAVGREAAGS